MRRNAVSRSGTSFWLPMTRISLPAPEAIGPIWLPLAEVITICPASVTAWALLTMKSGAALARRMSSRCVFRSIFISRRRMKSYFSLSMNSWKIPASSSVFDLPAYTCEPFGTRDSTSALAAAPSSTITTSKLRSRSLEARASSDASDAGAEKSTAVTLTSDHSSYNSCEINYVRNNIARSRYSNYRERRESESAGGGPGPGHHLDQPAPDRARHPGPAGGAPALRSRPLVGRVRAADAPGGRRHPPPSDGRDRRSARGQPQRHHPHRRPPGEGRPHRPRDAAREPAHRPRAAHRPRQEGPGHGRRDVPHHPAGDVRRAPRRRRGEHPPQVAAQAAREERRLAGGALRPALTYPRGR